MLGALFPYALSFFQSNYHQSSTSGHSCNSHREEVTEKMSGQDIPLRNLDKKIVAKLDQEAKKKDISREEYLRILLTRIMNDNNLVDATNQYKEILTWNTRVLQEVNEGQKNIATRIEKLELLISHLVSSGETTNGYKS